MIASHQALPRFAALRATSTKPVPFAYWLFCFAFAFDFRGAEGGSPIQYGFLAVALVCATYLRMCARRPYDEPALKRLIRSFAVFVALSIATVALYTADASSRIESGNFMRILLPFALALTGMIVVSSLLARGYSAQDLIKPLLVACMVQACWRLVYATMIMRIDIAQMRYQLLSPVTPILLGFGLAALLLNRRISFFGAACLFLALVPILLSVTRAYIISAAFVVLGLWLLGLGHRKGAFKRRLLAGTLKVSALVVLCVSLVAVVRPNYANQWYMRLTNQYGVVEGDVTGEARVAQFKAMISSVGEHPIYAVLGRGAGASYEVDPADMPLMRRVLPKVTLAYKWSDSLLAYMPFMSGLIPGLFFFFACGVAIRGSYRGAKHAIVSPNVAASMLPVSVYLMLLIQIGQSLTSFPFGERLGGLSLGIVMAIAAVLPSLSRAGVGRLPVERRLGPHAPETA